MEVSRNFTMSFQYVMDNRMMSPPFCKKNGDFIKFSLMERQNLKSNPLVLPLGQETNKREQKSVSKDQARSNKTMKQKEILDGVQEQGNALPINEDASLEKEDEEIAQKVLTNLKRNTNSPQPKKRKNKRNKDLIKQDLRELLGRSPGVPAKNAASKPKDQSPEELWES